MTQPRVALTGIKPTGIPHIGNYLGAIRPALALAQSYEARFFIADYHALNSIHDPQRLSDLTYEVAATWIACGLDPARMLLYRQSDVPETFELASFLMAFTAKGHMNRAHAYKDAIAKNEAAGRDADAGINMGLYTYPVLMAADILLFDTDVVPVGRDQKQHVEICADIAQTINHAYGAELLVVPAPVTAAATDIVPGLDGRKMSKSYDNTIPLFATEPQLKKLIGRVVTDSRTVEEPKDPDTCNVFNLYRLFAAPERQEELATRYRAGGMGYGQAKAALFEEMNAGIAPLRERYQALIDDRAALDRHLTEGAERARGIAVATMHRLRQAAGIGALAKSG
ncbi:MAG TPA: tryptophan--tRNA ligase [Anaerolineae bacterium]|nr:tryptophan--tRNA ligase [Ardenticatenia bacterium]MBK8539895.1 tryptophan--tRNA ligase [Ardenticatenia bacterium]HQZ69706.1 tryptophan--tRNA ligase [Anaerolineae bacterium]